MSLNNLLDSFLNSDLLIRIPALLIALTLHELAHGLVAYKLGDPTAKERGRLTLNPLKHLDPLGLLALLVFRFGWAKPVPVNPNNFKGNRELGMFFVGLAGPATNFLLAFIAALLIITIPALQSGIAQKFMETMIIYNAFLGVFNLLPFPPLDGSKVIAYFLPKSIAYQFSKIDRYGHVILMVLIFTGIISRILIPLANAAINIIVASVVFITSQF